MQKILRAGQLRQPTPVQCAYATIVSAEVALIASLNTQIQELGVVVGAHFGRHPDAENVCQPTRPGHNPGGPDPG